MSASVRAAIEGLGLEVREVGDSFEGPCPYHDVDDETWRAKWRARRVKATWSIRHRGARRGMNHCFGCKRGGSLADLVMHVIGIGYPTAREWIAELPDEPPPVMPTGVRHDIQQSLAFEVPCEIVWGEPLESWPSPHRRYVEQRGITPVQVARWGLAYAVHGRLAGRLILPVFDPATDEVVSYMARAISRDEKKRYLYPSRNDRPDLDVMFGERTWPEPEKRKIVVLTEGAINALAVERTTSAAHVAALGGSGIRPLHVAKLATFRRVLVCTDNDSAGNRAASALMAKLARHVSVARVLLPSGRDAADCTATELTTCLATAARTAACGSPG